MALSEYRDAVERRLSLEHLLVGLVDPLESEFPPDLLAPLRHELRADDELDVRMCQKELKKRPRELAEADDSDLNAHYLPS